MSVPRERLPLLVLGALFVGYAASYFHRADLAALAPLWAADPARAAMRAALPDIASLGMLVYAFGKLAGGLLADRFGGRRMFVIALAGAGLAELLALQAATPAAFAACRVAGMAVLGCAWPALGGVVAAVSPRARLATAMAFASQSYLVGDAAVRALYAAVVANGGRDAHVLGTAATGLLVASAVVGVVLFVTRARSSPDGALPPEAVASAVGGAAPLGVLAPMNFGLAMVRETLSLWTPLLLVEACAFAAADAVRASLLLPLVSGAGALVAGACADRHPRALLAVTAAPALAGALALGGLACDAAPTATTLVVGLAFVSAMMAMPMTLASGLLPLRGPALGRSRRLGIVDGAGSFGAVLAGGAMARAYAAWGVAGLFGTLGLVALASAALAVVVHRVTRRRT